MPLKTLLKIIAALAAVALVAVMVTLKFMDFNVYKGMLAEQAKAATGRDLVINGDVRLELSLTPALVANDVSFANAAWGSRPEMAKFKRIEAVVQLVPLISGSVQLERFVLISPDILLETNADGMGNWVFGNGDTGKSTEKSEAVPSSSTVESGKPAIPLAREIFIENGLLAYHDRVSNKTINLSLEKLKALAADARSPLSLEASGVCDNRAFEVNARLGSIEALSIQSSPFPVELEALLFESTIKINGTIKNPLEGKGLDLSLSITGKELAKSMEAASLPRLAGKTVQDLGPFEVSAHLFDSAEGYSLSDIKLKIGKEDLALIQASGAVNDVLGAKGLDLKFSVEGPDLSNAAKIAGSTAPAGPFRLAAHATDTQGIYALSDLKAEFGKSRIEGRASVQLQGGRPRLMVDLSSIDLDLNKLSRPKGKEHAASEAPKNAVQPPEGPKRVFSNAPFHLEGLRSADVFLKVANGRVLTQGLELKDLSLDFSLEGGNLAIRPLRANMSGGTLAVDVALDGRQPVAALKTKIELKKIDIASMLKDLKATDLVSSGKADMEVELSGSGKSLRELMAGLTGRVNLVAGEGIIENKYLDLTAADLINLITIGGDKKDQTVVNCFVCAFDVQNGLAASQGLLLDTEQITVGGEGNINLADETLHLTLNPRPKKKSLLSLAVPVNIRGTLADPLALPDTDAVAKGVAGAILGQAAMGPAGLLVPLVSKGTGEKNPCLEALLKKGKQPASPPASGKAPKNPQKEKVEEKVKDILKGLEGIFK